MGHLNAAFVATRALNRFNCIPKPFTISSPDDVMMIWDVCSFGYMRPKQDIFHVLLFSRVASSSASSLSSPKEDASYQFKLFTNFSVYGQGIIRLTVGTGHWRSLLTRFDYMFVSPQFHLNIVFGLPKLFH